MSERHPVEASIKPLARHYLKDMIYGANDGIITTFAVVSGVAGASLQPRVVLLLGFGSLLADGFSMAASNFLAIRSDEAAHRSRDEEPEEPYPLRHSTVTFIAFVLAGLVPLISYVLTLREVAFLYSVGMTLVTLFLVGAARAAVTHQRWWWSGAEMLGVGAIAAAVAYGIGAWLHRLVPPGL